MSAAIAAMESVCKECVRGHAEANQPWQCNTCKDWKEKDAFAQKYAGTQCSFYRVCATCEQTKRCDGCSVRKGQAEFTADAWRKCRKERLCKSCASKQKGFWTCCTCQGRKDIAAFQEWTESQGSRAQNGKQVCDACQRKRLLQSSLVRAAVTAQALHKRATERKRMRLVAEVWSEIDQRQALGTSRRERCRGYRKERQRASLTRTVAQSARQK